MLRDALIKLSVAPRMSNYLWWYIKIQYLLKCFFFSRQKQSAWCKQRTAAWLHLRRSSHAPLTTHFSPSPFLPLLPSHRWNFNVNFSVQRPAFCLFGYWQIQYIASSTLKQDYNVYEDHNNEVTQEVCSNCPPDPSVFLPRHPRWAGTGCVCVASPESGCQLTDSFHFGIPGSLCHRHPLAIANADTYSSCVHAV